MSGSATNNSLLHLLCLLTNEQKKEVAQQVKCSLFFTLLLVFKTCVENCCEFLKRQTTIEQDFFLCSKHSLFLLVLQRTQRLQVLFQAMLTTEFVHSKNPPSLSIFPQSQLHQMSFEIIELQTSEEKGGEMLSIKY